MRAFTKTDQDQISPTDALTLLKKGNERFLTNQAVGRNLLDQVSDTQSGQYPFACVLGCIDSRVPSELVFDQGIGDIFNVRIAGNFVNTDILGSMEFACQVAGSKLIVVLGHTSCGAIKGACDRVELGNLTSLLKNFDPVLDSVAYEGDRSSKNKEFVDRVTEKNVHDTVANIKKESTVLSTLFEAGEIDIVGAIYNVGSGKVSFL
jgi:carbonic anhydrase